MDNIIVIAVVALIVGCAVWYIRKEKRRGVQCVGCPDAFAALLVFALVILPESASVFSAQTSVSGCFP